MGILVVLMSGLSTNLNGLMYVRHLEQCPAHNLKKCFLFGCKERVYGLLLSHGQPLSGVGSVPVPCVSPELRLEPGNFGGAEGLHERKNVHDAGTSRGGGGGSFRLTSTFIPVPHWPAGPTGPSLDLSLLTC